MTKIAQPLCPNCSRPVMASDTLCPRCAENSLRDALHVVANIAIVVGVVLFAIAITKIIVG